MALTNHEISFGFWWDIESFDKKVNMEEESNSGILLNKWYNALSRNRLLGALGNREQVEDKDSEFANHSFIALHIPGRLLRKRERSGAA